MATVAAASMMERQDRFSNSLRETVLFDHDDRATASCSSSPHGWQTKVSCRSCSGSALGASTDPGSAASGSSDGESTDDSQAAENFLYIRRQAVGKEFPTEDDKDIELANGVRDILAELSSTNVDALYEQLLSCGVCTAQYVDIFLDEVFDRATADHALIPLYADLCARLEADPNVAAARWSDAIDLAQLLLIRCRTFFAEALAGNCELGRTLPGEDMMLRKTRAVGNVKFMGHLVSRGMLSSQVLLDCAQELPAETPVRRTLPELSAALLDAMAAALEGQPRSVRVEFDCLRDRAEKLIEDAPRRPVGLESPAQRTNPRPGPAARRRVTTGSRRPGRAKSPCAARPALPPAARTAGAAVAATPPAPAPAEAQDAPAGRDCLRPFCPLAFRRALSDAMRGLSMGLGVPAAVQAIRQQRVPVDRQAAEFADVLTRCVEEPRGASRRTALAFAAGLSAAPRDSAFDREACLAGVGLFFRDIYEDLVDEVPRLPAIVTTELIPTLASVLPSAELRAALPPQVGVP